MPILSERAVEALTMRFQELGVDWALAEDSAKAVLRVAADKTINGKLMYFCSEQHHIIKIRSHFGYRAKEYGKGGVYRSRPGRL